jgi:hypothetical protein
VVFVDLVVGVVAPRDVAALGSGNAAVGVIRPGNERTPASVSAADEPLEQASRERGDESLEGIVASPTKLIDP